MELFSREGPGSGPGQESGPGPTLQDASALCNRAVVDVNGEVMGSVVDVMLDLSRGCVAYAIVATDGFVGLGERHFAVPWRALRAEGEQFVLMVQARALATAPSFDRDHWPRTPSKAWHRDVHAYFHSRPYWESVAPTEAGLSPF
jgi:sporulation protein YlmC with PRC-barrel domain